MLLPQTEIEYRNALIDAAEVGASKILMECGVLKPFLKLREAYRLHGEGTVKRWISEGLINPVKDGPHNSTVRIDRIELLTVARTCNRATYLTTVERTKQPNPIV